ncbi:hypothetical protein IFR05_005171 [Cadophora sp. M221]|nr:hypothetical protein IFR05_005171 [Cadophora sp. M221]
MNSLEGNSGTIAGAATENMRSTAAKMGGRALSTPARSSSTPIQNRTWSPNNGIVFSGTWSPNQGIVFRPAAGTPRSLSTNDVEVIKPDHLLHSQVEDDYVMASAGTTVLELPSIGTSKATAADSKENPAPIPKKAKDPKVPKAPKTRPTGGKGSDSKSPEAMSEPGNAQQNGPPADTLKNSEDPKDLKPKDPEDSAKAPELEPEDPQQNELPKTSTTFKMTEELFRNAKNAAAGSPDSYWSHRLYRGPMLDGKPQRTSVHYCKTIMTTERVLEKYFADSKVIGFDIEWKENAHRNSTAKQNVSLIQIANEERIALFHVALYPKHELVSPAFKKLMEDDKVTKVGVSIKADCTRLRKHLGIDSKGMLELSHLYKLVKYSTSKEFKEINRRLVSLAIQTKEHLHLPMFKGDVRISDWSRALNLDQIMYAASDSYAGLQIFHTLEIKRKELDPTPPLPYHAELNLPIRIAEGVEIPSDAEAEEAEPEVEERAETTTTTKLQPKKLSKKELEAAAETVSLEDPELEYALTGHSPSDPSTTTSGPSLIRRIAPQGPAPKTPALFSSYTSPIVHAAETLASCHLDSVHNLHPGRPNPHHPLHSSSTSSYHLRGRNLRTYFLWYENPGLSLEEVGALLRKPALSGRSVAVGILEAIRVDGMPFEKERLRAVIGRWRMWGNKWVGNTRYGRLEEECGFVVGEDEGEKA